MAKLPLPKVAKAAPAPTKTSFTPQPISQSKAKVVASADKAEANRFSNIKASSSSSQSPATAAAVTKKVTAINIKDSGATAGEANRFAALQESRQPPIPNELKNRIGKDGVLRVTADTAEQLIKNPYKGKTGNTKNPKDNKTTKPTVTNPEPEYVEEDISGGGDIPYDPPVFPTPPDLGVTTPPPPPPPPPVKSAPIDTVIFNDDQVSAEIIADLLFEDIGGQEILTIVRHDTVNGQNVIYQPIKNLAAIQQEYSGQSLVRVKNTSRDIFGNFPINLQTKIPNVGNGTNGRNVYLDSDGNIVLEFINLEPDQQIEVQITSSGTIESIGE